MGSDTDRRELHAALEQHLGERPATILMDLLPPVGYADLVRQSDFLAFQAEIRGEFAAVRGEIAELRGEVRGQVGKFLAAAFPLMFAFAGLVLAAVKLA